MLVNGRISSRSYPRYRLARGFFRRVLADVDRFCMQSDESARRIIDIGADPPRVIVTGSLKFESLESPAAAAGRGAGRVLRYFRIPPARPVFIAASTLKGEETLVLGGLRRRCGAPSPNALLVIAPRKPERFGEAEALARAEGLPRVAANRARRRRRAARRRRRSSTRSASWRTCSRSPPSSSSAAVWSTRAATTSSSRPSTASRSCSGRTWRTSRRSPRRSCEVRPRCRWEAPTELADVLTRLVGDPVERARLGAAARALVEANRGAQAAHARGHCRCPAAAGQARRRAPVPGGLTARAAATCGQRRQSRDGRPRQDARRRLHRPHAVVRRRAAGHSQPRLCAPPSGGRRRDRQRRPAPACGSRSQRRRAADARSRPSRCGCPGQPGSGARRRTGRTSARRRRAHPRRWISASAAEPRHRHRHRRPAGSRRPSNAIRFAARGASRACPRRRRADRQRGGNRCGSDAPADTLADGGADLHDDAPTRPSRGIGIRLRSDRERQPSGRRCGHRRARPLRTCASRGRLRDRQAHRVSRSPSVWPPRSHGHRIGGSRDACIVGADD